MKFGLMFSNTGPFVDPAGAAALASAGESHGFDSLWTVEHVLVPKEYDSVYPYAPDGKMPGTHESPIPDPLIWLTWVAAATTTIKLATGILILPQRNPAILAKSTATLDSLSGGRLLLGIGVGWLEEEFDALKVPFERRGDRSDEYIAALRALWGGDDVSFSGDFVDYDGVSTNPKPVGNSVPVHIGGHSRRSARRAGELGDGYFPGTGNIPELLDMARQYAADAGRDPESIEMTANHPGLFGDDPMAAIEEAESWGVHRLTVPTFLFARAGDGLPEALGAFAAKVGM